MFTKGLKIKGECFSPVWRMPQKQLGWTWS